MVFIEKHCSFCCMKPFFTFFEVTSSSHGFQLLYNSRVAQSFLPKGCWCIDLNTLVLPCHEVELLQLAYPIYVPLLPDVPLSLQKTVFTLIS